MSVAQFVIERWKRLYGRIESGEVAATQAQRQMAQEAVQELLATPENPQASEARRRRLYGPPGPLPWPYNAGEKPADWLPRPKAAMPELQPCEFCGYRFDHAALGHLNCPNCDGEGLGDVPL